MKSLNEFVKDKLTPTKLFDRLFEARQQAHIIHLKTDSYAKHVALNEFYDSLLNLTDEIIEVFQGQYGLVNLSETSKTTKSDNFLEKLGKDLIEFHEVFDKKDSHLHNLLDEIIALTYRTLYKIKFLN